MKLTGSEFSSLADALRDAYVDYDSLRPMLRSGGWTIQDITSPGPMPTVISDLIEHFEARDQVHELIEAARAANPTNVKLLKVSAAIGLDPGGVAPGELTENEAYPRVADHLERMVDGDRGIMDLGSFAARLQELIQQVCAVELGDEFGTGFLIGPGTILTNYHVVEKVIKGEFDAANIRVRFDYKRLRDGLTANAGVAFELADDWLVHGEPYSAVDMQPYDEARLPAENELDYAVLRTREAIGHAPPSGPATGERGWVVPRAQAFDFAAGSFLMVVQHPCHDPISFDDVEDAVVRVNPNGTRVHYRTNTMPGSSGSPVLDRRLELVALHHGGEPGSPDVWLPCSKQVTPASYNEGIPIAKVQAHVAGLGLSWVFGGSE